MSFIMNNETNRVYQPGWFLSSEKTAIKKTRQIPQSLATTADNGTKYVPMGTIFPSNDANATGIICEDVDVASGDIPGSVVTSGEVIAERLPVALAESAKTALEALGFKFVEESMSYTRPY